MGSCRTFGGARPSSSIGNGPPAPPQALRSPRRMGRTRGVLGRLGLVNVDRLTRALSVDLPTLMAGVEAKRSREVPGRRHARHDATYGGRQALRSRRPDLGDALGVGAHHGMLLKHAL